MNTVAVESIFNGTLSDDIVNKMMASINKALSIVTAETPVMTMKNAIFESCILDDNKRVSTL